VFQRNRRFDQRPGLWCFRLQLIPRDLLQHLVEGSFGFIASDFRATGGVQLVDAGFFIWLLMPTNVGTLRLPVTDAGYLPLWT
jgi:hypothetical protein